MTEEHIESLANLLTLLINDRPIKPDITNPQYVSMYLSIFLDEADLNNGNPVPYDSFGEALWQRLNRDANDHPEIADNLVTTWTAWVHLYRHLKDERRLNSNQKEID
jgi:hypothetical protein